MNSGFRARALGEIAIRCRDYTAMQAFYRDIIGLEILSGGARGGPREGITFFRLGESFGGHVAVLALFDGDGAEAVAGVGSALHHIAFSLPWDEQNAAELWLQSHGYPARFEDFEWAGWRGLFTCDPDGNTVELVAALQDWHVS